MRNLPPDKHAAALCCGQVFHGVEGKAGEIGRFAAHFPSLEAPNAWAASSRTITRPGTTVFRWTDEADLSSSPQSQISAGSRMTPAISTGMITFVLSVLAAFSNFS